MTTWTTDRPTEPGEYWLSLKPSSRAGILPTQGYPLAVTMFQHGGDPCVKINGVAFGMEARCFDGAKWSRRETPADPFHEVYQKGVRAAVLIIAGLCGLCVIASLSGCLTATKIGQWQRAVHSWSMAEASTQACRDASALAGKYLATANTDILGTGKLTDLSSDSQAKELVTSAALACGRRMP